MKIQKLIIKNYKIFKDIKIDMNEDMNIFIGQNNSGKTTILEAISLVLTGKLNGINIMQRLTCDWFNKESRKKYTDSLKESIKSELPSIIIEAYFFKDEKDPQLLKFKGANNSLHEDTAGIRLCIEFDDENYQFTYNEMLKNNNITDIPIDFYKVEIFNFAGAKFSNLLISKKIGIIRLGH